MVSETRGAPLDPSVSRSSVAGASPGDRARGDGVASDFPKIGLLSHIAIWAIAGAALLWVAPQVIDFRPPIEIVSAEAIPDSGQPGARVMTIYHVIVRRSSLDCFAQADGSRKDAKGLPCDAPECSIEAERSWMDVGGFRWPSPTAHLSYGVGPQDIKLTMNVPMDAAELPLAPDGSHVPTPASVTNGLVWTCSPWVNFPRIITRRTNLPPLTVMVTRP